MRLKALYLAVSPDFTYFKNYLGLLSTAGAMLGIITCTAFAYIRLLKENADKLKQGVERLKENAEKLQEGVGRLKENAERVSQHGRHPSLYFQGFRNLDDAVEPSQFSGEA